MKRIDIPRILFLSICVFGIFLYGVASVRMELFPYPQMVKAGDSLWAVYVDRHALLGIEPIPFLQPARKDGDGVTINNVDRGDDAKASDLVLIASFYDNQNALRLIDRDGAIVAQWRVSYTELFPDTSFLPAAPNSDWNVDTHGSLITPDGSVVFNFEYAGMVSLDRCGAVNWRLSEATHHSIERTSDGGFWVPSRRYQEEVAVSPFPPFPTPYYEDTVLKLSAEGSIERQFSVPQLLVDQGMESFLTASGRTYTDDMPWDQELVHLNKVSALSAEIADDFPLFEAGDLLISLRNMNLIIVVDAQTHAVKWQQIGPWIRQHDPSFQKGGNIVLFNNAAYSTEFVDAEYSMKPGTKLDSTILSIDPVSRIVTRLYGDQAGQEMLSIIRGKVQVLDDRNMLITESDAGRAFEIDPAGTIVWEYMNRYSETHVAEITGAGLYPASYFTVSDWSCPLSPSLATPPLTTMSE